MGKLTEEKYCDPVKFDVQGLSLMELMVLFDFSEKMCKKHDEEFAQWEKLHPNTDSEDCYLSNHWFQVNEDCEMELIMRTGYNRIIYGGNVDE